MEMNPSELLTPDELLSHYAQKMMNWSDERLLIEQSLRDNDSWASAATMALWNCAMDAEIKRRREFHVEPFTVIYTVPGDIVWRFFEANGFDAEGQCVAAHPEAEVLWVNEGHGPESRVMQGLED